MIYFLLVVSASFSSSQVSLWEIFARSESPVFHLPRMHRQIRRPDHPISETLEDEREQRSLVQ
jgi:hypothetical protein